METLAKKLVKLIISIIRLLLSNRRVKRLNEREAQVKNKYYTKKNIMTKTEEKFYHMFAEILGNDYIIWPQINLATIIKKNGDFRFQSELYRNVDFGIFSKSNHELLLLIEINDETHNTNNRRKRDITVDQICEEAGYKLIKFWVDKPNDYEYVKGRILSFLSAPAQKVEEISIK